MSRPFEDFAKELGAIVEEEVNDPDRRLDSIPLWDSVAIVAFMALASEMFDVIVDPERLASVETVGDLYAYVASGKSA